MRATCLTHLIILGLVTLILMKLRITNAIFFTLQLLPPSQVQPPKHPILRYRKSEFVP